MEEKVYRSSIVAIIWNTLSLLLAIAFISFLVGYFMGLKIGAVVAVVIGFPVLVSLVRHSLMKITIQNNELDILIGKKHYHYLLSEITMRATRVNNDDFQLEIVDASGHKESFDLSTIGLMRYYSLLEDLKLTGEHSQAIKLEVTSTKTKGE